MYTQFTKEAIQERKENYERVSTPEISDEDHILALIEVGTPCGDNVYDENEHIHMFDVWFYDIYPIRWSEHYELWGKDYFKRKGSEECVSLKKAVRKLHPINFEQYISWARILKDNPELVEQYDLN